LHSLPNIVSLINSRRMSWMGHIAYMGDMRNAYKIFVGKLEGQ
jgi:hypothetical protein